MQITANVAEAPASSPVLRNLRNPVSIIYSSEMSQSHDLWLECSTNQWIWEAFQELDQERGDGPPGCPIAGPSLRPGILSSTTPAFRGQPVMKNHTFLLRKETPKDACNKTTLEKQDTWGSLPDFCRCHHRSPGPSTMLGRGRAQTLPSNPGVRQRQAWHLQTTHGK